VKAFVAYIGRLKMDDGAAVDARATQLLGRLGLAETMNKKCEELSKGMLQKIQFVAAIIHEPDLLILDEPFSGLDPVSSRLLRDNVIAEHRRGATILFSTHVMTQAEEICDHVVMIHRGCKVLDDPLSAIRSRYDPRALHFEPLDASANVARVRALAEVESCVAADGGYDVELRAGSDPGAAIARVAGALPLARIEVRRLTLEDIFVQIVTGGVANETGTQLRAELAGHEAEAVT